MKTIGEMLRESSQILQFSKIENASRDVRLIIAHALNETKEYVFSHPERILRSTELKKIRKLIVRRSKDEPVALITGKKEFWSLPFKVSAATLIPRPDTETLIYAVKAVYPDLKEPLRILDLGTGSGCLLLALLQEYKNAEGIGVDISKDALDVAQSNAEDLRLGDRSTFFYVDWNNGISGFQLFDIVICNPPYLSSKDMELLPANVADYEPRKALFGGIDGLREYKTIIPLLKKVLIEKGNVFFEVGINQADFVAKMLKNEGFFGISAHSDFAGISRCVFAKK